MSNKREIEPSLDYFELRRRHEEYKNNQKQKEAPEAPESAGEAPVENARPEAQAEPRPYAAETAAPEVYGEEPVRVEARTIAPGAVDIAPEVADVAPAVEDAPQTLNLSDTLDDADAPSEGQPVDDALEDDDLQEDGRANDNPNPFDSFIHAFKGLRGKLSGRFGRRGEEEVYEDDAPEEELSDEVTDGEGGDADAPAVQEVVAPVQRQAEEAPSEDAAVEDVLDEAPSVRQTLKPEDDVPAVNGGDDDEDYDDGDYDEEADEEPKKPGRLKRFMRLFVVRVDEDEDGDAPEDELDEDGTDEGRMDADGSWDDRTATDDGMRGDEAAWAAPKPAADENEGGPDMSDLNNVNTEVTNTLAAELEGSGMSRRERRELAQRKAAEKAAAEAAAQAEIAKAEAEAAAQKAETEAQKAEEVVQAEAQKVEARALEADAVEDVSKGIVNIEPAKEDYDVIMDEPTREFKPVSKASLDDLMNDKDLEDDKDEEEEKPARRGLFGRRRKVEDDEDDEDEDDDDDEEEDERPRRGLFGRRRARDDEDDEDEDDYDEDDEDDRRGRKSRRGRRYDEDDEDDYDDYDDDDYDDDEDEGTSFGHVLLGILKGFLTAVMLLLFVVVVLNVLNLFNVISLSGLASRLPTRMVSIFLPTEGMKQRINVEANANPAPVAEGQPLVPQTVETPAEQPQSAPAEEAPAAEAPVEEAPAEEAPAEEAPAENGGEVVG